MPGMDGTCPDCGSEYYRDGHRLICPTRRMHDQRRQMRERAGPEYDRAVTGSRAGTAAWRAAGSPAKVTLAHVGSRDADGNYHSEQRWYLAASLRRGQLVEATPEQVAARHAWCASRPGQG
jgi:hypothetical protein